LLAAAAGCANQPIADMDEVYFAWDEDRTLCGVGIDDHLENTMASIRGGISRAAQRSQVLVFYAHDPGVEVSWERLDEIAAATGEAGVEFLTFADLEDDVDAARAGVLLTFDDDDVARWSEAVDRLAPYGVRATFFVTRFDLLSADEVAALHELAAAGHAIENHGHRHIDAPDFVDRFGIDAYVRDEVLPGLEAMRSAGFSPRAFAYPFGFHTSEIDRAVLEHVDYVRSLSWSTAYPLVHDPC
jgi:peptidoglycan/xylan/chitin deacetylase (PgdA/CDA1 family)